MSGLSSWPEPPSPPPRNSRIKAKSVVLVEVHGKGARLLENRRKTTSYRYSDRLAHTLNVEIDRSELGLRELLRQNEAASRESLQRGT